MHTVTPGSTAHHRHRHASPPGAHSRRRPRLVSPPAGEAADDIPYYCGWTIVRRDAQAHFIASRDFPTAGSSRRAWCGEMVVVIGLTLNARRLALHCAECNQRLKQVAHQGRLRR